ncbi:Protein LONGIFOLIA 1 [Linum grandiflorum]
MTGVVQEQQLEKRLQKQIGCMAGFLQIFDRNQILVGKRLHSAKRLPPPPVSRVFPLAVSTFSLAVFSLMTFGRFSFQVADSAPEPGNSIASQTKTSPETEKQYETRSTMPSPDKLRQSPAPGFSASGVTPSSKSPLPLPCKFGKETPRLSLDSRATVDAKGRLKPRELRTMNRQKTVGQDPDDKEKPQNRSSSVIAKLMGLELLPKSDPEPVEKQPELRRSASESRANRDLPNYRFIDGVNFQLKQPSTQARQNVQSCNSENSTAKNQVGTQKEYNAVIRQQPNRATRQQQNRAIAAGQTKSYYDSADFFPEPKQQAVSIYGEIEKRLRMRGIDEPSKDLETLKQILEALQLKGLLHSNKLPQRNGQINSRRSFEDSPIVVMKPARSTSPVSRPPGRIGSDSPPASFRARAGHRRDSSWSNDSLPAMSPRRDRPESERNARARGRNCSSPTRSESDAKSPIRRRPLSVESQRRIGNETVEQSRRVSPVQSPKIGSRKSAHDQSTNQSPRNRRRPADQIHRKDDSKVYNAAAKDESSTVSESSLSANSQSEAERSKDGKNILDRCDTLLNSIAEMTAATADLQPSPISVLDSSFYKDESSPSPVMKRNVDFKGERAESEDDTWSGSPTATGSAESDDGEFTYVSDILRASSYLPGDSDVFLLLEKQQRRRGKDTSKVSRLQRRLIFDTINEILKKKRELPPWKAVIKSSSSETSLNQIWSEFQRIQVRDSSEEDLFEVICGVLRKDLAGDAVSGWEDFHVEMSEVVLDIERLVFKDLIGETIRDLAKFSGQMGTASRRKLDF